MILTKEQVQELELLSKPLIKFLNENFNPHVKIIITPDSSEILSGSAYIRCEEFIKD